MGIKNEWCSFIPSYSVTEIILQSPYFKPLLKTQNSLHRNESYYMYCNACHKVTLLQGVEKNRMFICMLRRLYCVANISKFHPEHIGRHIK